MSCGAAEGGSVSRSRMEYSVGIAYDPTVPQPVLTWESDRMDIVASSRWLVCSGCLCAGLGVAAGAFGAHMLKDILDQPMLAVYDTATRYQMYHAFGMVLSGFAVRIGRDAGAAKAGWMFLAGIFLFSGSLYGVSLLGVRWLGAVTPVGGALFIVGWGLLAWRAWRWTG